MEVKGRDLVAGVPKTLVMNSDEMREALAEPVNAIVDAVRSVLERTPPELAADIVDRGIVLTGGGAQLRNLDVLLREETGLPVMVCDHPSARSCWVPGAPSTSSTCCGKSRCSSGRWSWASSKRWREARGRSRRR